MNDPQQSGTERTTGGRPGTDRGLPKPERATENQQTVIRALARWARVDARVVCMNHFGIRLRDLTGDQAEALIALLKLKKRAA